jgi:hypothetical protein
MEANNYIIQYADGEKKELTLTSQGYEYFKQKLAVINGTIYPKYQIVMQSNNVTVTNRTWSDVQDIVAYIKGQYFSESEDVMKVKVTVNNRLKRCLGRMLYKRRTFLSTEILGIELSSKVINGTCQKYLEQVLYHEFVHAQFPNEGHTGYNFRMKEKMNPYREKKTNCLTRVS